MLNPNPDDIISPLIYIYYNINAMPDQEDSYFLCRYITPMMPLIAITNIYE